MHIARDLCGPTTESDPCRIDLSRDASIECRHISDRSRPQADACGGRRRPHEESPQDPYQRKLSHRGFSTRMPHPRAIYSRRRASGDYRVPLHDRHRLAGGPWLYNDPCLVAGDVQRRARSDRRSLPSSDVGEPRGPDHYRSWRNRTAQTVRGHPGAA
jgi:hypothetical protein